ncbi:T cell receptor beta variable 1 [Cricetulus griseus]
MCRMGEAEDSTVTLLEQKPRWGLVLRGQAVTLSCILKDSQYPWMSWYQQDPQQQLQWLVTLRSSGDKEVKSLPGADYLATRVTDTELRLQVANVTQGRTLYCTCSADTVKAAVEAEPPAHVGSSFNKERCGAATRKHSLGISASFPSVHSERQAQCDASVRSQWRVGLKPREISRAQVKVG